MLVNIKDIVVTNRIRKDLGNIDELAEDIKKNGLIEPIVVDKNMVLIAGERRLRACQSIGMSQIEVHTVDVKDQEHAWDIEIAENEMRKQFLFSELMNHAKEIYAEKKKEASKRMSVAGKTKVALSDAPFRTDEAVAKEIGIGSASQLRKGMYIAEHADKAMMDQIDKGDLSINAAFVQLQRQLKETVMRCKKLEADEDAASDRMEELYLDNVALKEKIRTGRDFKEEQNLREKVSEMEKKNRELEMTVDHKESIIGTKNEFISGLLSGSQPVAKSNAVSILDSVLILLNTIVVDYDSMSESEAITESEIISTKVENIQAKLCAIIKGE